MKIQTKLTTLLILAIGTLTGGFLILLAQLQLFLFIIYVGTTLVLFTIIFIRWLSIPIDVLARSLDRKTEELRKEKASIEQKVEYRTRELKEAQARLQSSIQSLRIGFIITDNKSKIIAMNGSAKLILLRKKLIGGEKIDTSMYHKNWDMDEVQKHLGDSFDLDAQVKKCISEMKPIEVKEVPFGERYLRIFITPVILYEERQIGIIGSAILIDDITEAKILERSRDEFFSIASHELRTPLTALRGNSLLLKQFYGDKIKDQDFQEMVSDMHEASVRLIELVNDFLDVSRLEQGKIIFKKEKFDLTFVIKEEMHEVENLVSEKKLQLIYDFKNIPNLFVLADEARTKQVISNLLGNAITFTEKGYIKITIDQKDEFLLVRVQDSGKGISRKNQNLLFRKFQQAGENILTRDVTRGTGLGLYISRLMLEGMGGEIYLEKSEEGKGSTFVFTLPIGKSDLPVAKQI